MNTPINKSWVSLCLLIHWKFENLCFVSILTLVFKLQLLFDGAVTKEFICKFGKVTFRLPKNCKNLAISYLPGYLK